MGGRTEFQGPTLRRIDQDLEGQDYLQHVPLDYTETFREAERLGAAYKNLANAAGLNVEL